MIKFIGAILIISGTSLYGFYFGYIKQLRIKRLKQMKETFILMSGQIDFAIRSIPQILINISKRNDCMPVKDFYGYVGNKLRSRECSDFNEAWNEGVNLYLCDNIFTESDREIFRNVGNMPVYLDKQMQIKELEENIKMLEEDIINASENLASRLRIYRCTGISAGIFIVLILL